MKRTLGITRCAMFTAIGSLFLSLGYFLQLAEFFWFFMATVCVIFAVEMCGASFGFMTSISICICAGILNGFNYLYLFPFVTFMCWHPIIIKIFEKKTKPIKSLGFVLMLIWFYLDIWLMIKYTALLLPVLLLPKLVQLIFYLFVPILFWLYDHGIKAIHKKISIYLLSSYK